ncbi:MAG: LysM peptidoglycan-binding domain-containing protein [Panacibacter sp.]
MKKICLLLVSCVMVLSVSLSAQNAKYTTHILVDGETLSMLATKYKTTVGDIMRLNGMHADSKLVIGQKIKIPGSGQAVQREGETKTKPPVVNNTAPPPSAAPKKSSTGLTHIVEPKETMYSISKKYGITIEQLQKWNYKKDNNLEVGEVLAVNVNGIPEAVTKRKEQAETQTKAITAIPDQTPPLVAKEIIKVDDTATENVSNKIDEKKTETSPDIVLAPKQKERPVIDAAADGSDNFFAKNFGEETSGQTLSNTNGIAMIFKTASGWNDKKYYVLMNEAPSGSIVKISAANGNIVYAKVLWKLDDMRENRGLQFRISEAAAAALNVQGDKFPINIQY